MQPGDPILLRSSYRGVVRWCWPHHYVGEWNGRHVLDSEAAASVRAVGERVVDDRPWPTGWEEWRPPTTWRPLALPIDWDVL